MCLQSPGTVSSPVFDGPHVGGELLTDNSPSVVSESSKYPEGIKGSDWLMSSGVSGAASEFGDELS